jgi:hypothetical protein
MPASASRAASSDGKRDRKAAALEPLAESRAGITNDSRMN